MNIGEWSEFYVFLKILSDRKLVSADSELNPLEGQDIPVIKIIRKETTDSEKVYSLLEEKPNEIIYTEVNGKSLIFDSFEISSKLKTIFKKILDDTSNIPEGEYLLKYLDCSSANGTPRGSKEDLTMVIHDPRTNREPLMSYSIKSQVGSPSTLLNASGATNFIYELITNVAHVDINSLNNAVGARHRIENAVNAGMTFKYFNVVNETFKSNMELIDYAFPEIMATLLLKQFSGSAMNLVEIINSFSDLVELPVAGRSVNKNALVFKLKNFLVAVALGMKPSKIWSGMLTANGGYLILKKNGDLVCYHIFNINDFQDYLLNSTKFERGSETRHGYGKFYEQNGKIFINLNLQIRFTK